VSLARSRSPTPLSERAGQCCGGRVTLFYEAFPWRRRQLAIFGAGHVGQAIGGLAPYLDHDVVLIDSREESELQPPLPADRPYRVLFVDSPEVELDHLPADTSVLVMTHSHALDQDLVARALTRGGFPYLGLIGSDRKWGSPVTLVTASGAQERPNWQINRVLVVSGNLGERAWREREDVVLNSHPPSTPCALQLYSASCFRSTMSS
jgi:xanthine dehydrogenase accessory factor